MSIFELLFRHHQADPSAGEREWMEQVSRAARERLASQGLLQVEIDAEKKVREIARAGLTGAAQR